MQLSSAAVATENPAKSRTYLLASSLLTAGFLLRVIWAASVFLNADEAMHYVLSNQPSFALTYQATLSTAHPPLFIVDFRARAGLVCAIAPPFHQSTWHDICHLGAGPGRGRRASDLSAEDSRRK